MTNILFEQNLTDEQLQQIVDKTILQGDEDGDGKISFEEFVKVKKKNICPSSGKFNSLFFQMVEPTFEEVGPKWTISF